MADGFAPPVRARLLLLHQAAERQQLERQHVAERQQLEADYPDAAPTLTGWAARLAAPVSITLPRGTWINLLSWAHTEYPDPAGPPWAVEMVAAVESAVDAR